MKKIKDIKNTLVFKLIFSIILIFIIMTATSNYIIGKYQEKRILDIGEKIVQEEGKKGDDYFIVLEDSKLKSTKEIKNFSLIVISSTIALGSLGYYVLVSRLLRPLKKLKEKVQEIDVDNIKSEENIYMPGESHEIEELSLAFEKSLDKIYSSYAREKSLSSAIAHELNTPISIMKSSLEIYLMKNKVSDGELKDLVEEVAFDLEEIAEEKNVKVISNVEDKIIYSNDILLERVLFNLGKNGILYNIEGGSLNFYFKEDEKNYFIEVRDTGIGISDEEKDKVFDLFYRVDGSRNRKSGGYGIGLNLVKNIMEKLNGEIKILDNINEKGEIIGSIFEIILPKIKETSWGLYFSLFHL